MGCEWSPHAEVNSCSCNQLEARNVMGVWAQLSCVCVCVQGNHKGLLQGSMMTSKYEKLTGKLNAAVCISLTVKSCTSVVH